MYSFIFFSLLLVAGYFIYGKFIEKVFVIRPEVTTPAYRLEDGVDFVPMPKWKTVLIQLLNIAGTGPIFGAIAGALFGPAAFAWIVFGCIFAGAVHDYKVGMLSLRSNGQNISEIVGKYLGNIPRQIMRVFSIVLLIFVGVVFVYTPAEVLRTLLGHSHIGAIDPTSIGFFYVIIAVIIAYYLLATVLPIDKIIGRIYPIFGACLLIMAVGITAMMFITGEVRTIPEFAFQNMRPDRDTNILGRIFPFLFITIACGAISGFHATQSPLMARCLKNEKEGRQVFYGSMILEGIIAMIWAAVTMAHFNHVGVAGAAAPTAPNIVTNVSITYLGVVGGILAVFGVVAAPITSGDTAFRSARLTIADILGMDQKPIKNRFLISIPLYAIGIALVMFAVADRANFNIIWRYFAWSNQTLATIGLWAAAAYLAKTGKLYCVALIPAAFMTSVVTSYFFTATETLGPLVTAITGSSETTYIVGLVIGIDLAIVLLITFIAFIGVKQNGSIKEVVTPNGVVEQPAP